MVSYYTRFIDWLRELCITDRQLVKCTHYKCLPHVQVPRCYLYLTAGTLSVFDLSIKCLFLSEIVSFLESYI